MSREHMVLDTNDGWGMFSLTERFGKSIPDHDGGVETTIATCEFRAKLDGWRAEMKRTTGGTYLLVLTGPDGKPFTEATTYSHDTFSEDTLAVSDFNTVIYLGKCLADAYAQLMAAGTTEAKLRNDGQAYIIDNDLKFTFS